MVRLSFVFEDKTCRNRRPFPCECIRERKMCTDPVVVDKCTHGPAGLVGNRKDFQSALAD